MVKDRQGVFPEPFAKAYCQGVRNGQEAFGKEFLTDDDFLLQSAILAQVAGERGLQEASLAMLRASRDEATQKIVEIAFDPGRSDVDKLVAVHAIENDPSARWLEQVLYCRLPQKKRESSEALRAMGESLLEDGQFAGALAILEKLPTKDDPQALLWRAWSEATLGQKDRAQARLDGLAKKNPQSPWGKVAEELARDVRQRDQSLNSNVDRVLAVFSELRKPETDCVEGDFTYRRKDGREAGFYAALGFSEGKMELIVTEAGQVVAAYQVANGHAKAFLPGEPSILVFEQKPMYLAPSVRLPGDVFGNRSFFCSFHFTDSPGEMARVIKDVFNSQAYRLRQGGLDLLQHWLEQGWLPAPAAKRDKEVHLLWVRPIVRRAELDRFDVRVADDHRSLSFRKDSLDCKRLCWGPKEFRFSPPKWPDLPVVKKAEMDPTIPFRVLCAAGSTFYPSPNAAAERPTAERR